MQTSNHPHADELQAAYDAIENARNAVNTLLHSPELQTLKIGLMNDLTKPMAKLGGLMGHFTGSPQAAVPPMGPATQMFGKPVEQKQPLKETDLTPGKEEKEIFRKKRDDLYERFPTMTNEEVAALLDEPQGDVLVRAVAKKAGMTDYREVELTHPLFDQIREEITDKAENAKKVNTADKAADKIKNNKGGKRQRA